MRRTTLAVGVLLLCAPACNFDSAKSSSGTASSTPSNREIDALMQTSRDWAKAAASGDVERILSYWADDAVVLEPDQRAHFGKAGIRQMVEASMKIPKFMGYVIEHNRVSFADSTGKIQTQFGKAVTIWRKDASGAWKCVVDIWNGSPTVNVHPAV